MVTGIPVRQAHAPARSQLPLWARATTAPGPAYAVRSTGSLTARTRCVISRRRPTRRASISKKLRRCEATARRARSSSASPPLMHRQVAPQGLRRGIRCVARLSAAHRGMMIGPGVPEAGARSASPAGTRRAASGRVHARTSRTKCRLRASVSPGIGGPRPAGGPGRSAAAR